LWSGGRKRALIRSPPFNVEACWPKTTVEGGEMFEVRGVNSKALNVPTEKVPLGDKGGMEKKPSLGGEKVWKRVIKGRFKAECGGGGIAGLWGGFGGGCETAE